MDPLKIGGPLVPGPGDYDKLWVSGDTQHRIVGKEGIPRSLDPTSSHIVRQDGPNGPITYARINGVVLSQEQLNKINKA